MLRDVVELFLEKNQRQRNFEFTCATEQEILEQGKEESLHRQVKL